MSSEDPAGKNASSETDDETRIESSAGESRDTSEVQSKEIVPDKVSSAGVPSEGTTDPEKAPQSTEVSEEDSETKKPASLSLEVTEDAAKAEVLPPEVPHVSSSDTEEKPRQVIAVSASKGPAAFFNLARKFLVTDEMCDLSALEGAIVSAVDAAHLLERSKLATIVRIQTSYVTVEPKRKRLLPPTGAESRQSSAGTVPAGAPGYPPPQPHASAGSSRAPLYQHPPSTESQHFSGQHHRGQRGSAGSRELRRARIVITVKRTESYKQWLEENPVQAILAGDADDSESQSATADTKPSAKEA